MAKDNKEVEIKIPVAESDFLKIKTWLAKNGKLVKSSSQEDDYFTPAHRDFTKPGHPFEWLSIRKRGEHAILNYKHFHPEDVEVTTYCDEFETELGSLANAKKIFEALDMKALVKVKKEREVYVYGSDFEISLDKVEELGFFIEIEALSDLGGEEETRKRLIETASFLGLNARAADTRGYPYLLMKKKGLL